MTVRLHLLRVPLRLHLPHECGLLARALLATRGELPHMRAHTSEAAESRWQARIKELAG